MEKDAKIYEDHLKLYQILVKKYKYYLDEYNSYLKTGDEITKIEVKLTDETNAKNCLIEENLEVELSEKLIKKSNLMTKINNLKLQIKDKDKELNIIKMNKSKDGYVNYNNIMVVHFISGDGKINQGINCLPTETFAEEKEKNKIELDDDEDPDEEEEEENEKNNEDKLEFTLFDYMWLFNTSAKNEIIRLFNSRKQK